MDRRRFLKLAAATAGVGVPTLLGYSLLRESRGQMPPLVSPYAPPGIIGNWPARHEMASPILVLVGDGADNPFGPYLCEILRAEGLNCFQTAHTSVLEDAPLEWYDLVLLAEGTLSRNQASLLEGYVARGGRLVAMRPDQQLAPLFGVERATGSTTDRYVQVEAGHPMGQGIATELLQFHGTADHYRLAGAQPVAWLAGDAGVLGGLPAVTTHHYRDGQAAMWAYDLARSVAYTRQGNPAWANQDRDGLAGIRATDMLEGWVDLGRLAIPQADEQQRLLANLLTALSQGARPLPRLWYLPREAKTLLVATGDAHGNPAAAVEDALARVERRGGHMSVYYAAYPSSDIRRATKRALHRAAGWPLLADAVASLSVSPTPAQVAAWRERGHEFGLHPYVEDGLAAGWSRYWHEFTGAGYGPVPPTVRTHRVLWQGWAETARVQAAYGIRMNLDYYHLGPAFCDADGRWPSGYLTGSALPMRFVDEEGQMLNIYQQPTQLADEHLLTLPWVTGQVAGLSAGQAVEVSCALLRRSLAGAYGAVAAQFHIDPFALAGEAASEEAQWLEGTLDYAMGNGIPICSAQEWLRFVEVRHDAEVSALRWDSTAGRLSFDLVAERVPGLVLAMMLPLRHGGASLVQVQLNGATAELQPRQLGSVPYGCVLVSAGAHRLAAHYA